MSIKVSFRIRTKKLCFAFFKRRHTTCIRKFFVNELDFERLVIII